jgi:DNA polymerase-1
LGNAVLSVGELGLSSPPQLPDYSMSNSRPSLYLIDAYAIIYRSYYAFIRSPRVNSKGLNTSAMFGFTNTLLDVINNCKPTHLAVAFDISGPVFRNNDFEAYKANREETPDDIKLSIPYIRQIVEAFNIPILEHEGYEADDVIGTIAKTAEKNGFNVYMVTPDKDFGQLVTEHIKIFRPGRQGNDHEILGIKEVCEKFEVKRPEQVIDVLGLWGDSVDNIPGIPGIGEKTAKKLLADFDTVEGVIANADKLKGKMKENVIAFAAQALLSKKLATIITDVPVVFDSKALELEPPNKDALRELFGTLEFRTLAERMLGERISSPTRITNGQMDLFATGSETVQSEDTPSKVNTAEHSSAALNVSHYSPEGTDYRLIETKDKRNTFVRDLLKQKTVCFDTETTSVDANNAALVGMSFSWKEGQAFYIPFPENENAIKFILDDFRPFFENENILKIGHNLKYDITVLHWYGIRVANPMYDTMLAHYLLQPDMRHGMDELSETYLAYRPISISSLIGKKGKDQMSMRDVPVEEVMPYACEDADITLRLYNLFSKEVQKQDGLEKLLKEVEMPLMPVLADMEATGIKIDLETLKKISEGLDDDTRQLESEIYALAGKKFNISSPKQLGIILFEELQISDKAKKTKTGQYATNEETLQKHAQDHPIINLLLDYREVVKLKSTYVDALPGLVNPRDGRIHTTYMQAVAATGRLSSQNPNLQNIPVRTARGKEIRKAFIPSDSDHIIFAADYSQIELRLIAELSGDEGMMTAFIEGEDIHAATAAKVFDVPSAEVTREMRNKAKTVNFGIIYGISAFGLSQRISVSRTEAAELINNYFEKYSGVKQYMDNSIAFAREHGYVETIMKRRRYLKDINAGNPTVRGFAERNAINAPIQGSAADMIKIAMIRIDAAMKKQGFKSKMMLQVHDELVFDALKTEVEMLSRLVENEMKNAIPHLKVPIKVDMDTGENWLQAH